MSNATLPAKASALIRFEKLLFFIFLTPLVDYKLLFLTYEGLILLAPTYMCKFGPKFYSLFELFLALIEIYNDPK